MIIVVDRQSLPANSRLLSVEVDHYRRHSWASAFKAFYCTWYIKLRSTAWKAAIIINYTTITATRKCHTAQNTAWKMISVYSQLFYVSAITTTAMSFFPSSHIVFTAFYIVHTIFPVVNILNFRITGNTAIWFQELELKLNWVHVVGKNIQFAFWVKTCKHSGLTVLWFSFWLTEWTTVVCIYVFILQLNMLSSVLALFVFFLCCLIRPCGLADLCSLDF